MLTLGTENALYLLKTWFRFHNVQLWLPPVIEGLVTVVTAYGAYRWAKGLEERKLRDQRFRQVFAPILEKISSYLRYFSTWRVPDRHTDFDAAQERKAILNHIEKYLGDFGPKVTTAYLDLSGKRATYDYRGGELNYVAIIWLVLDEATTLIASNSNYTSQFRNNLAETRNDYFLWAALGDEFIRWRWNVRVRNLVGWRYRSLANRYLREITNRRDDSAMRSQAAFVSHVVSSKHDRKIVSAILRGDYDGAATDRPNHFKAVWLALNGVGALIVQHRSLIFTAGLMILSFVAGIWLTRLGN